MRENCTYGSEGGVSQRLIPTPIGIEARDFAVLHSGYVLSDDGAR